MNRVSTLVEGFSTLVEGRLPHATARAPVNPQPKAAPMSPPDELRLLERSAQEKGMSDDELAKIRLIGDCPAQVQTRIGHLHKWLAAH